MKIMIDHPGAPPRCVPLRISDATPARVKSVIQGTTTLLLEDVHTMLLLPVAEHGLYNACNFSAAIVLCAVAAGLSRLIWNDGTDRERFIEVFTTYYPWAEAELAKDRTREEIAGDLYYTFRNPLVHALGMPGERKHGLNLPPSNWRPIGITRSIDAMHNGGLALLEQAVERPQVIADGLIIHVVVPVDMLHIEALYWGVRQMIERATYDEPAMAQAEAQLEATERAIKAQISTRRSADASS